VLGIEPMTYGSESEYATHYTTAPQTFQLLAQAKRGAMQQKQYIEQCFDTSELVRS